MNKKCKHTAAISYTSTCDFKPDIKEIKKNIFFLLDMLCSTPTEVSVRFCDAEEMTKTNHQFRNKNKATDVLSFVPMPLDGRYNFLGDILICIPVCETQAKQSKKTLSEELLKMLTHGIVHLKGFDHERSESAERVMSQLERTLKLELQKKFGKPHFERKTK